MAQPQRHKVNLWIIAIAAFPISLYAAGPATAPSKIVCWKDQAGKVIGCGDKVPPEFQESATKELDSRGVTRKSTESVAEVNQRRVREQETGRTKADEDRKLLDSRRQDTALLATYSNDRELDLKRDRDLQVIDVQMEQLTASLKSVTQRANEAKARFESVEKSGRAPSSSLSDELVRVTSNKQQLEQNLLAKQKEKEDLRQRFADHKKRYNELRGSTAPSASVPTSVAEKK
jgi:chromosome segregation ATPase